MSTDDTTPKHEICLCGSDHPNVHDRGTARPHRLTWNGAEPIMNTKPVMVTSLTRREWVSGLISARVEAECRRRLIRPMLVACNDERNPPTPVSVDDTLHGFDCQFNCPDLGVEESSSSSSDTGTDSSTDTGTETEESTST